MSNDPQIADPRSSTLRRADQADGLRRLFASARARFVAVVSNPHVAFCGVLLERLTSAFALQGLRSLVVDAAESAPTPHELSVLDLATCVEPLSGEVSYLAARGLPLRFIDARGSSAALLQAVADSAPQAEAIVIHATAAELSRIFAGRTFRPVLLAADHPRSVTHAYGSLKLLAARNGLRTFDLLLAADPASPRRERIAEQMASCADHFIGAVLHDWAAIDPARDIGELPDPAVRRIAQALMRIDDDEPRSDAAEHQGLSGFTQTGLDGHAIQTIVRS
jgi:flagellar biosynthesis protein FlhG